LKAILYRRKIEEGFRDWYTEEVIGRFLKGGYRRYEVMFSELSMLLELSVPNHVKGVASFR
jgi:hypothetical protein